MLNCDIPPTEVWVRDEFLHAHASGHGDVTRGYAFGVASVPGQAIGFHVLLENGAQYGRLPIHALLTIYQNFAKSERSQSRMPDYEIEMECTITKRVTLKDCPDEATAHSDPWEFAIDEIELEQIDWNVLRVREVKLL